MENNLTVNNLKDNAGVIMFPPLLYFIFMAAGIVISLLFPHHLFSKSVSLFTGILLIATAILIVVLAVRKLVSNKTTVHPAGKTKVIVSDGVYSFTRNPMYLSFTLVYIAVGFLFNAWFCFALLIPLLIIVQKGIIEREEKYLTRKFGDEYLKYKSNVRRWI